MKIYEDSRYSLSKEIDQLCQVRMAKRYAVSLGVNRIVVSDAPKPLEVTPVFCLY